MANGNRPPHGVDILTLKPPGFRLAPGFGQESRALLYAPMIQLPVDSAPLQRLGDFDGDLDVVGTRVISNGLQNEITVWENHLGALPQAWQGTYPLLSVRAGARCP